MRTIKLSSVILLAALAAKPIAAQTYSACNPLINRSCPPNEALSGSLNVDFTSGASDAFTSQGNPTYDSNGVSFTVAQSGDSPQLNSKKYIMFGHVDFVVKPAPGVGIVSSAVLQSDDLDEIDWEWVGGDANHVQSNYFSKGQTTSYNRGASHDNPNNQADFHTYSIDWTAEQIAWQIDGTTVRTLTPTTAQGQYPQTPMMIKFGAWSGGDSANEQGTIAWAGGPTNYADGPFTMQVKSVSVTDYSTGTQYTYSDSSGTWTSIQAVGGKVNPSGGKGAAPLIAAPPAVTAPSNSAPMPFEGTHREKSTYVKPNIYPWVPTTLQTNTVAASTTYPGLPEGWTVRSDGKVLPPSSAALASRPFFPTPPPEVSQLVLSSAAAGDLEPFTVYNEQGFPVIVSQPPAVATAVKHFDDKGFLISSNPNPAQAPTSPPTSVPIVAENAGAQAKISKVPDASEATNVRGLAWSLGTICWILGGALAL